MIKANVFGKLSNFYKDVIHFSLGYTLLAALWFGGWFPIYEFMPNLYVIGNSCVCLNFILLFKKIPIGNEHKKVMEKK